MTGRLSTALFSNRAKRRMPAAKAIPLPPSNRRRRAACKRQRPCNEFARGPNRDKSPAGALRAHALWSPTGKPVAPSGTPVGRNPEQEPPAKAGLASKGQTEKNYARLRKLDCKGEKT